MVAEYINNKIEDMIKKTNNGLLVWKAVDSITDWENVKKQIEKTKEVNLKHYFIDDTRSYAVCNGEGYILVLNLRYANAPVFSPVLDKYILVIKINGDHRPENLSNYGCQEDEDLLPELVETIERQREEKYIWPDCIYNFLESALGEDKNGRIINE